MFELYIAVLVVWWVALIASSQMRDNASFGALVVCTIFMDVFMGLILLGWVTNVPFFQEMSHEADVAVGTHFLLPWFAPQVLAVLVLVGYEWLQSKKESSTSDTTPTA